MNVRKLARADTREDSGNTLVLTGVFLAFFFVMSVLSPKIFLSMGTMRSLFVQLPEFGIYAFAMMLAMLTGGIDLSIVSAGNLASIIASNYMIWRMSQSQVPGQLQIVLTGLLIALAVGAFCGALNGISVAVVGIPPMLATLASMQMFNGVSMILTQGSSVQGLPELFSQIGAKTVADIIPITMLAFLVIAVILHYILDYTALGFKIYMFGSNSVAAEYSGINNTAVVILTYTIGGLLSAIAGIIVTSRTMSAKMDYGSIYQLQAILAVVLGGISPSGGKGKVWGVVLAVMSLQVLSTGLNILNLSASSYLKNLVWGLLLLAVLTLKFFIRKKA